MADGDTGQGGDPERHDARPLSEAGIGPDVGEDDRAPALHGLAHRPHAPPEPLVAHRLRRQARGDLGPQLPTGRDQDHEAPVGPGQLHGRFQEAQQEVRGLRLGLQPATYPGRCLDPREALRLDRGGLGGREPLEAARQAAEADRVAVAQLGALHGLPVEGGAVLAP